jgi:hypothetical protein
MLLILVLISSQALVVAAIYLTLFNIANVIQM